MKISKILNILKKEYETFSTNLQIPSITQQEKYRKVIDTTLEILDEEKIDDIDNFVNMFSKHKKLFDYETVLYLVCKMFKPKTIVETGVQHGFSSYAILKAIENFQLSDTKLVSIDYNNAPDFTTGWICKNFKTPNWELINGKTSEKLLPILEKVKPVDLFAHDSSHNQRIQLKEYTLAWKYLPNNGILISDDIGKGFDKFTQNHQNECKKIIKLLGGKRRIGIILKN